MSSAARVRSAIPTPVFDRCSPSSGGLMPRPLGRSVVHGGLVLLGLCPAVARAQEATNVSGRVTAAVGGAPLVGAALSIATLRVGATTDAEGRYQFTLPAGATGEAMLTARRIGYVTRSVRLTLTGGALHKGIPPRAPAGALTTVAVDRL